MTAWTHPVFIAVGLVAALVVAAMLFRVGDPRRRRPDFECDFCGRRQQGLYAKEWRYCPYCGTPRRRSYPRY